MNRNRYCVKVREFSGDECAATISVIGTPLEQCAAAARYLRGAQGPDGAFVEGRGPTPEAATTAALAQLGRAYLAHIGSSE